MLFPCRAPFTPFFSCLLELLAYTDTSEEGSNQICAQIYFIKARNKGDTTATSGFRLGVNEICALLGFYLA